MDFDTHHDQKKTKNSTEFPCTFGLYKQTLGTFYTNVSGIQVFNSYDISSNPGNVQLDWIS